MVLEQQSQQNQVSKWSNKLIELIQLQTNLQKHLIKANASNTIILINFSKNAAHNFAPQKLQQTVI